MSEDADIFERLRAPFPGNKVHWRIGSTNADKTRGMALAYIDARDVMDRLDEVCGPDKWSDNYEFAGPKTVCNLSIWTPEWGWVSKADGAGDTDVEGEKGALSDAFKRAAVKWGIGRYLYALDSPWVQIEQKGKTSIIPAMEREKLARILDNRTSPSRMPAKRTKAEISAASKARTEKHDSLLEDLRQIDSLAALERFKREVLTPQMMSTLGNAQFLIEEAYTAREEYLEQLAEQEEETHDQDGVLPDKPVDQPVNSVQWCKTALEDCETTAELDKLRGSEEFKRAFYASSAPEKTEIASYGAMRRLALSQAKPEDLLGAG